MNAADRCFQKLGYFELRQGALQAIFSCTNLDAPNVGRYPAVERHTSKPVAGRKQAHAPKHGTDFPFSQLIGTRRRHTHG